MTTARIEGTVIIYGPHYARSGFGLLARVWALALHNAGARVRIVPIDCNDPKAAGDLDDFDLYLLRSLQYTPIVGPVTAIFAYVPTYVWPKMSLPEPHLRIMLTTFDSTANAASPPARQIYMCNQMDQVWVANAAEEQAWIRGGMDAKRIRSFNWPHNWLESNVLPSPRPSKSANGPFRFLHISVLLPRRRLDVLLRAFFEEFRATGDAELVLKMSYPSWHPVPGKPQRDLKEMIARLREETGSSASVIVDETLGTRLELVRLIDSCDAYVSTDTTHTAPVAEAIFRELPVIITDGWGVDLPPQALVVPNSKDRVAITPEMADYMPHQRGASFPALDVGLLRQALRQTFSLTAAEKNSLVITAVQYMRERYSCSATAPAAIKAINEAWADKRCEDSSLSVTVSEGRTDKRPVNDQLEKKDSKQLSIHWGGLQLFYGKLPKYNREIALELIRRGHDVSLYPGNGPFHVEELELHESPKFIELADCFHRPMNGPVDINVSCRWHPIFNEQPASRQILVNPWWSGAIPTEWVRPIGESVSEIWVPSHFVRDNFLAGGIHAARLHVVPMGIDPVVFNPEAAPFPLKTRKGFKFLFVGETSTRRGFDILLGAYLKTFTAKDDVCLVVKDMDCQDYYGRLLFQKHVAETKANPLAPEIEYLPAMLTEAELAGLYTACDCFVQPHRAASFNLAALEAMACGRPIITTDFGGVRDFAGKENSYLIPAKTTRYRPGKVGHWTVRGEQLHAEVDQKAVAERLRHVFQHATEAQKLGARGGEFVRENFTWKKSADRVLDRMRAVLSAEDRRTKPVRTVAASADTPTTNANGPTVVIYAPFYNRSGYGVAARALASALHAAGLKIRIMPVDNVEEGIDDCDLTLLHSLEKTPLTSAVVAVFFHVASPAWLKIALPPQSARILFTTFDGTAQGLKPPAEWVSVCNQMDQLWLQTEKEAAVFASAGVAADKIHALKCPHPWISNPSLPDAQPRNAGAKFRFLSIAMFQPRRRWDTLLEAFLTEFKETPDAELYLKVNYPLWHPVPGQPAKDLRHLIETLRQKTGSNASVILDEELGTRAGICRLIDSCDAYASTDTTLTAPVGEAFVRAKIAIIPDGYGADLPYCEGALIIPIDPKLVGPMTEEMLQYQPHHRGREMPLLRVEDVRQALRSAYELPESQRHEMGRLSALVMDCKYGPTYVTPAYLKAIDRAVKDKLAGTERAMPVSWEGPFLDYGSLSFVNRALTSALTLAAKLKLSLVGNASLTDSALRDDALQALAKRIQPKAPNNAEITVRHQWPPDWRRPKQGKLVVIQPWEYGILPVDWVQKSADVDEFWAYTHYVRQVYISSGIDAAKVKIVPLGIDPGVFRPDASPRTLSTAKRFKFLFVGGTIYRKGPDILLAAYLDHFTADDDVCLVIKDFGGKSVYAGQTLESQIKAAQLKPNAPEILYLNEELLPSELPALYTACDCFVHPYRGEGFGLPILEAMACGLPVIVTAGGSADDFATDEFAYRIPATRKSIGDNLSGMKLAGSGWVLEPDVTALSRRMRWVATHREEARLLGMRAANYTRRHWTWERAASIAEGYLQNLAHLREHSPSTKITNTRKITVLPAPAVAEIGSLVQAQELFRKKSPRSAWESASEAIRMRPHHPDASLLLAEIARMIGDSENARRCAQHALSLAPNSKPAKKFLQGNFNGTTRPEWLILPPGIELHENKIPGRGRLSVCLIVKDEERFIGQCLASVKGLADQIVVVDTGSTDQTKTIAQEKRAEVHSFPWNDDFSAARNEALAHANGDWVLFLDADEELPAENHAAFRAMLANESAMSWRMPILDAGHEEKGHRYMVRLFRNAPGLHFVGRVHEQIFPSIEIGRKEGGLENRIADVALRHHGYTPELIAERGKTQRNLRWLEKALSETPDDPTLLTNQGLELSRDGRIDEGLRRYQTACEILAAHPSSSIAPESRQVLLSQYSAQLISAGKPREAITLLTSSIARQAEPTASLHFQLGLAYMEIRDFPAGAQQMRHCLAKRELTTLTQVNPATRGIKPRHHLAVCLWQSNERDAADSEFQIASTESSLDAELHLDYAKFLEQIGRPGDALQLLHRIAMAKPEVAEIWQFGGAITLKYDELIGVALEWTDVAIQNLPDNEDLLRLRAEALLLNGHFDQSLTFWTRLNPSAHISAAAGIVTCETMLGLNQFDPPPAVQKTASDQFMTWYWRFVQNGAEPIVVKLLDHVDSLEARLPEAATILRSIIKQLSIPAAT